MIAKFITDIGLWPQDEELRHMVIDFKIKVAVTKNLRLCEQNMIESRNPQEINIIQAFINQAADEVNIIIQAEDDQFKEGISNTSIVFSRLQNIDVLVS